VTNVIGGIGLLMFLVLEGTRGPDSHGQDPKMSARGGRIRCPTPATLTSRVAQT
jgi:hypothetical protein